MIELPPLPAELPEAPVGWTRRPFTWLKVEGGSIVSAAVYDANGREMPITYTSDTRPGGLTGFTLHDVSGRVFGWKALRDEWPRWLERTDPTAKDARLRAANQETTK